MTPQGTISISVIVLGILFIGLHIWQWKRDALDNMGRASVVIWAFVIVINASMLANS